MLRLAHFSVVHSLHSLELLLATSKCRGAFQIQIDPIEILMLGSDYYKEVVETKAQEEERTFPSQAFTNAVKKTAQVQQTIFPDNPFKSAVKTMAGSNPLGVYFQAPSYQSFLSPLDKSLLDLEVPHVMVFSSQSTVRCHSCGETHGYCGSKATDNLRMKRVRPWETCDDVQELKRMLTEKEEQIVKLQKELKSAKNNVSSSPAGAQSSMASSTPEKQQKEVSKLKKSIQSQVSNQMAYKPSAKFGSARLVPVEITDVAEILVKSLLGETLTSKATNGPKQLKFVASNNEVEAIFAHSFSKRLRYGATLELKGLTFLYTKATSTLKVTGNYAMEK